MDEYGVIYALSVDGRDFRYVGLTKRTIELRLAQHERTARSGRESALPVHTWMREHGPVQVTVLSYALVRDLHAAERWWIAEIRELGYDLLNRTSGGQGTFGWIPSAETRARLSAAMTGKTHEPWSTEVYERIAAKHRGMKRSDETRARISAAMKGKPQTEAQRANQANLAKIAAQRIGWNHTPETREKISKKAKGRVSSRKGAVLSEETRKKISESRKAMFAKRKANALTPPDTVT